MLKIWCVGIPWKMEMVSWVPLQRPGGNSGGRHKALHCCTSGQLPTTSMGCTPLCCTTLRYRRTTSMMQSGVIISIAVFLAPRCMCMWCLSECSARYSMCYNCTFEDVYLPCHCLCVQAHCCSGIKCTLLSTFVYTARSWNRCRHVLSLAFHHLQHSVGGANDVWRALCRSSLQRVRQEEHPRMLPWWVVHWVLHPTVLLSIPLVEAAEGWHGWVDAHAACWQRRLCMPLCTVHVAAAFCTHASPSPLQVHE